MRSTWASDSCSSVRGAFLAAALWLVATVPAAATVYHSQSEALELAFPDADRTERRSFVLTQEQTDRVEQLAQASLSSKIVTLHVGYRGEELLGYAHIDVHTVRTLSEALMVVLTPTGQVRCLLSPVSGSTLP